LRRLAVAAAALLAVATFVVAPSWVFASPPKAAAAGCAHGYSYGGYASRDGVHGITAEIAAQRLPRVSSGHAAAWIGVGGIHEARGGANAWLQAGIAAFPRTGLRLYVEEVSLGQSRHFVDLGAAAVGRRYSVNVVETAHDVWQAYVDGRPAGRPAYLPTGGGSWRGVATAESWAGGRASCNRYGYRFDRVAVLHGSWNALSKARPIGGGVSRAGSGFAAIS
jgi:hypothetical protein